MAVQEAYYPGVGYVPVDEYFSLREASSPSSNSWPQSLKDRRAQNVIMDELVLANQVVINEIALDILERNGLQKAPWLDKFLEFAVDFAAGKASITTAISAGFNLDCVFDLKNEIEKNNLLQAPTATASR